VRQGVAPSASRFEGGDGTDELRIATSLGGAYDLRQAQLESLELIAFDGGFASTRTLLLLASQFRPGGLAPDLILRGAAGANAIERLSIDMAGEGALDLSGLRLEAWGDAGETIEIRGTLADETLTGSAGDDIVRGGAGNDRMLGQDGKDSLEGEAGADFIGGGAGDDTIRGGEGDDTIFAGIGNDDVGGGAGNDQIFGGTGANVIHGGLGNDTVQGGSGNDTIHGSAGRNQLFGNDGADVIFTSAGGDLAGGGPGNDSIFGADGQDTIFAGLGDDFIGGGAGNDQIFGGAGRNRIFGGVGNDTITAGTGKDVMTGGPGADTFVFVSAAAIGIGAARDVITDFITGVDSIDLRALGTAFNGNAGLLGGGTKSFFHFAAGGLVIGDQNGDGVADWVIELTGAPAVAAGDFLL
jgi:Ca2+-binding RTX toxin-like protein